MLVHSGAINASVRYKALSCMAKVLHFYPLGGLRDLVGAHSIASFLAPLVSPQESAPASRALEPHSPPRRVILRAPFACGPSERSRWSAPIAFGETREPRSALAPLRSGACPSGACPAARHPQEPTAALLALAMAEILMAKLPSVYTDKFLREGVFDAVTRLSLIHI